MTYEAVVIKRVYQWHRFELIDQWNRIMKSKKISPNQNFDVSQRCFFHKGKKQRPCAGGR